MKRIIIYVMLILALIVSGVLGYMNKPLDRPKEEILGVTYYRYNSKTNNYDEFSINKEKISYTGTDYDFDGCEKYTYNPDTSIIKLDCNKAFKIGGESKNTLKIEMNDKTNFFYAQKESSYNYEFQRMFGTTENMYKQSGENKLRTKEIDLQKLEELIKEKTPNFIYIKNNDCDTACTIFNHTLDEFSSTENTYYLNLNKLTDKDIKDLNEEYATFPKSLKELTKNYPQVLIVQNGELKETIKIELNGFDDSKYKNYADKYGEEENENNE